MGKNQGHKQMQRSRHGAEGPDGQPAPPDASQYDGADVSFHTPEWHAARIAALTTERMSWEDWKKKQKDEEAQREAVAQDEEKAMREYRAQLDADRQKALSKGTNHAHLRGTVKEGKVKKKKGDKSKKKKKNKEKEKEKEKKRSKKTSKDKKSKKSKKDVSSSSSSSSSDSDTSKGKDPANGGPVRLSDFMQS